MEKTDIIIETENFLTIKNICESTRLNRGMNSIIGGAGYGKTTTLKQYSKMYSESVVYVWVRKSMNAKIFFSTIYNTIGGESYNPNLTLYFIISRAATKFNSDNTNKLLIIDEAGKFSPEMLEYLHEFRDLTKETTGIILAGPEYFQDNITEWMNKNKRGIPEVYSRINKWFELNPPKNNEKIALAREFGIQDRDFEEYIKSFKDLRQVKDEIDSYLEGVRLGKINPPNNLI